MGSSAEYVAHVPTCVLALGDMHGDLQQAEAALRLVGATNETGEWAAGSCTLVQTGDLVDRGPDSFAVLQRFDALAAEAAEAGGAVVTLLGNHELFSLQGVLHYVHPRELHALGQYASEGGRAEDLLHSVPAAFRHAVQQRQGMQQVGAAVWAHAMGPEGWAGRLLRSRKTIAVVGEGACRTLFVHAGLLPDALALFSASAETDGGQARGSSKTGADLVDRVNAGVVAELARCDGAHTCPAQDADKRVHWLFGSNGVFWTRDYAMQREGQFCGRLQAVLDAVGAKQAVSGHTVQASGNIGTRCGLPPHLYLIDVGISRSYQGGLGAWKCLDGQAGSMEGKEDSGVAPDRLPFGGSRLRSYRHELQAIVDPGRVMDNAIAISQFEAAHQHPEELLHNDPGADSFGIGAAAEHAAVPYTLIPDAHRKQLEVALSETQKLRMEIAGMEALMGAVKGTYQRKSNMGRKLPRLASQNQLRQRAADLVRLRQSATVSPEAAEREAKKARTRAEAPDFAVFFKGDAAYASSLGDTVAPVGRMDAVMLASALDDVLPEGAMTAKYRLAVRSADEAMALYENMLGMRRDFELVDVALRECSRQNAAQCVQRAQVLENVRSRYMEMFNVAIYVTFMLQAAFSQVKVRHDEMQREWSRMTLDLEAAKSLRTNEREKRIEVEEALAAQREAAIAARDEMQGSIRELETDKTILMQKIVDMETDFQQQLVDKDALQNDMCSDLQDEVAAVKDERDELIQRLRMTERQLARAQKPEDVVIITDVKAIQTNPVFVYNERQEVDIRSGGNAARSHAHRSQSDEYWSDGDDSEGEDRTHGRASAAGPRGGRRSSGAAAGASGTDASGGRGRAEASASRDRAGGKGRDRSRTAKGTGDSSNEDSGSESGSEDGVQRGQGSTRHGASTQGKSRGRSKSKGSHRGGGGGDDSDGETGGGGRKHRLRSQPAEDLSSDSDLSDAVSDVVSDADADDLDAADAAGDVSDAADSEPDTSEVVEGLSEEDFTRLMAEKAERKAARKEENRIARTLARQEERAIQKANAKAEADYIKAQLRAERKEERDVQRVERTQQREKEAEQTASRNRCLAEDSDDSDDHRGGGGGGCGGYNKVSKPGKVKWEAKKSHGISRKTNMAKQKKSKVTDLGGFRGLLNPKQPGRIKGEGWLMKQIVSIYVDYLVQENNISRGGMPAEYATINEFVYQWHINKFGIKSMAELNIVDLIVTVRAHAEKSHRVKVFGNCTQILPTSKVEGTTAHMDFYLFCMKSLAGQKPVQTLFTEDDKVEIRGPQLMEGLRSISRQLQDDSLKETILQALQIKDLVKGKVLLSRLTPLLMSAFQRRWLLSNWHFDCLMQAIDFDEDGLLDWDAFKLAGQLLSPKTPEATVMRLYDEATKISKRHDKCATKKAILRLRAGLDGLWSLEKQLPKSCLEMDEDGVSHLTDRAAQVIENEACQDPGSLETRLTALSEVCQDQGAMARIGEAYTRFLTLMDKAQSPPELLLMAYHVVQAALSAAEGSLAPVQAPPPDTAGATQ